MLSISIATFGERLRLARFATGMTRKQLARAVNLSVGSIESYESRGVYPSLSRVAEMTAALGVSIDWLMGSDGRRTLELDGPVDVEIVDATWIANAVADGATRIEARDSAGRLVSVWEVSA